MNTFDFLLDNPLAQMDFRGILLLFIVTIAVAYAIARYYRNDYNVKKILKSYVIYFFLISIVSVLIKIKMAIVIGVGIMGLIILIFRSNHYFYES